MSDSLNAEVIAIGTEILLGELTDTNSVFIARALRDLGINLYFMTSVGDNEHRIAQAIQIALSRAQVVITCGGLGPTVDDKTREAVAMATGRGLSFHQDLLEQIAARFAGFQVKMTENNRRQAFLPDGAKVVENPVGTAPSFIVEQHDAVVISLPGVPREMKFLMTDRVVPYLRERFQLGIIKARTLRTAGVGESALDELIGNDLLEMSNPTIGLAAHSGQVDVRITAKAETEAEADRIIAETEAKVRERIGTYIYGVDGERLEGVLLDFLKQNNHKLAVAVAGMENHPTQALQAQADGTVLYTAYPTPEQVRGGFGLSIEMPLRDVAVVIAEQLCRQQEANAGIAIISNPDVEEASDANEGTAVAVYTPHNARSRVYGFGGKSEMGRIWSAMWTLSVVWQMLREQAQPND
jgi:nicotinamide-nucleotide amidase